MYLDTHERDETEKAMMRYYLNQLFYVSNTSLVTHAWRLIGMSMMYLIILTIVIFKFPHQPWWVYFGLWAIFALAIQAVGKLTKKKLQEVPDTKDIKRRLKEVSDIEVDTNERQLFMRLVAVLVGESHEDLREVIQEVTKSQTLSQLTFIRELDTGLKKMMR
jgi:nitrate reductase NapAB chaperone NapD